MNVREDHQRLLNNLRLLQKNYSVQELADVIGVSKPTWITRMKEPWRCFSYDDFVLIAKYCNVDFLDITRGPLAVKGE